jgi:hypothetical protein
MDLTMASEIKFHYIIELTQKLYKQDISAH